MQKRKNQKCFQFNLDLNKKFTWFKDFLWNLIFNNCSFVKKYKCYFVYFVFIFIVTFIFWCFIFGKPNKDIFLLYSFLIILISLLILFLWILKKFFHKENLLKNRDASLGALGIFIWLQWAIFWDFLKFFLGFFPIIKEDYVYNLSYQIVNNYEKFFKEWILPIILLCVISGIVIYMSNVLYGNDKIETWQH